jgi:hypothetical protein
MYSVWLPSVKVFDSVPTITVTVCFAVSIDCTVPSMRGAFDIVLLAVEVLAAVVAGFELDVVVPAAWANAPASTSTKANNMIFFIMVLTSLNFDCCFIAFDMVNAAARRRGRPQPVLAKLETDKER